MEKIRRYDLDWLRVLVFGLLIFYHVGMFFVPWGWHIKNNETYGWLRWPMLFLNQWRLPILFVISGMGTAFALSFRSGGQFIKERGIRLAVPLFFGMLVIVPPQVYLERLVNGDFQGSYWLFYLTDAFKGIYPEGNFSWHHLWFLPYLFVFSALLTPVFLYMRSKPENRLVVFLKTSLSKYPISVYYLVIPLFLFESLIEPFFDITHNLIWDWFNFISSLTLFFYGFLLISVKDLFWSALEKIKQTTLVVGILAFFSQIIIWLFFEDGLVVHFVEAAFKTINMWSWILTIFGYAAIYLNKPGKLIQYANKAVYPFYIVHQTITIIIGYYVMHLEWNLLIKASAMVVGTFVGSFLIYEFLIRRIKFMKPLFGVK